MSTYFWVFYQSCNSSYRQAQTLLERYAFKVERSDKGLLASAYGFSFDIVIHQEPSVLQEAKKIAKGGPHQEAMSLCDARFEVTIENLEKALDEINTLMEIQGALQDASKGYLYLPWNKVLSEPYLD